MNKHRSHTRLCVAFLYLVHSFLSATPTVSELSLEEKVGQLLMVHFHGEEANEEAQRLIQEWHVGGIIYYRWGNGLYSPRQVAQLSEGLQQMAVATPHALPLLLAVDQEGGTVNRLKKGFTHFPSNYALGLSGKYQWGRESARIMGHELKTVGISFNLAPVADVYTNPVNPVIGIRAFSSDPLEVAKWANSCLQGYHHAGIVVALKHFPGHGDASVDSHEELPCITKTREELDQCELLPFRILSTQADAILTSHLMFPSLDPDHCATFSKKIITDLLRNQFNFQGVIMTDSLAMQGILSQCPSLEEAVLRSFEAGHDMILLGGKQLLATQHGLELSIDAVKRVCQSFMDAVGTGRIAEKKLDEAVARILALKEKARLFDLQAGVAADVESQVGKIEHQSFALQIARRALRISKTVSSLPLSIQTNPPLVIVPEFLKEELEQTSWNKLRAQGRILYFKEPAADLETIQTITNEIGTPSCCVYFAYRTWRSPTQQMLFSAIRQGFPSVTTVVLCDPLDEEVLSSSDVILSTYGTAPCSLQAAYEYLFDE